MVPVRVPTGVWNFIQRIDVSGLFGPAAQMPEPSRHVQCLLGVLDDLPFEEIVVEAVRAFLGLWDVLHVEVEPKNAGGRSAFRVTNDCSSQYSSGQY